MLQMYMSRSPRVCDCSFRLRTLLFSSLLSWTIRPVHSYRTIEYTHTVLPNFHIVTVDVTNVKLMKSILLSKEKLCLYIHESLEHHGSPWKLTIANTSGGE
jgi:hypothetical protein